MSKDLGPLVRLVDVVLTLLFGFIMIADLDPHSRIVLPQTNQESNEVQQELQYYTIIVKPNNTFGIMQSDQKKETPIPNFEELEKFLVTNVVANTAAVVIVDPEENTQVQQSVNVLDLCMKYKVKHTALDLSS